MKQVVVRPAAAADIEDAFLWYERQREGLGSQFLDALRGAMDAGDRGSMADKIVKLSVHAVTVTPKATIEVPAGFEWVTPRRRTTDLRRADLVGR